MYVSLRTSSELRCTAPPNTTMQPPIGARTFLLTEKVTVAPLAADCQTVGRLSAKE